MAGAVAHAPLERDDQLRCLAQALDTVQRTRAGACALVCGEAGIGKTALVDHFARVHAARTPCLRGNCEALFSPRPLGPLVDIAADLPPALGEAIIAGRGVHQLFPALLAHLRNAQPGTLLMLEDVHWADEATLDFVKHLGRRIEQLPVLLIVTYRDDELEADHPLRRVLGELPARSTHRIGLPLLSEQAVERLAQRAGRSVEGIHRATDGNPFFVTEVLAASDASVPSSIRDAMLARLARLSDAARAVVELTSLSPAHVTVGLVEAVQGPATDAIDEALSKGLLVFDAGQLRHRHELARRAVEQSLSAARRSRLHAAMFAALVDTAGDKQPLQRLVHHAEGAGLDHEVLRLAPVAAREAARVSAHREAARLYALALARGARLDASARADLLEARAHECMLTNLPEQAIHARVEALELRRRMDQTREEGNDLRWLARLHWLKDANPIAHTYAEAAIAVLERLPRGRDLAMAYSTLSQLQMVTDHTAGAVAWGERAIELAGETGDVEALVHALNNVGTSQLQVEASDEAWAKLERSLALALEHGLEEHAARAFNNLQTVSVLHREYARAFDYAERGIAFCDERDLDLYTARLHIRRAYACIEFGRWHDADHDLLRLGVVLPLSPLEEATSGFVRGLLAMRRGESGAEERLLALMDVLRKIGVHLWFTATASACAEAAWLRGDAAAVEAIARPALALANEFGEPWRIGQLAMGLKRAGRSPPALRAVAHPYACELEGEWRAAAREWGRLGCPYDRGLALLAGDEAGLREALEIFETLGARPAAELARRRLRSIGARGVRRGHYAHARADPMGLTRREREVHDLLARGMSNDDIALRLHRSTRTVEHHVSAILAKLGVPSRAGAIVAAAHAATRDEK
jgi:DNA-binding CsgD family transcriptional regulator